MGQQGALSRSDTRLVPVEMADRKERGRQPSRSSLQSAPWFISFAFQMNLEGSGVGAELTTQMGVGGEVGVGVSSAAYEQPRPAATAGLLKYYLLFFLMSSPSSSWR